jgi:uncharacterized protein
MVLLMTLDAIIAALKSSGPTPSSALTAAVAQAEALAPLVFGAAEKFCRGVHLLPGDSNVLFYGLHVLAAARHPGLLDQVLALARQPSEDLNQLFPEYITPGLSRILLNVWDRSLDDLLRLIEHADMGPEAKWVLCDVLGRLTCEGRFDRSQVTDFLARIERDGLIDDDDMTWWGWESTVVRLGLVDLEPALQRVWDKPIFDQHNAVDRDDALQDLAAAAAEPGNPRLFDEEAVRPIDDVLEAVAWVDRRVAALADIRREREEEHGLDTDVARAERLTEDELDWLGGLLVSRQVPPTTMSLEMLDGFLTSLVLGPELVPMSQYLPIVWGTDDGEGPVWDGMEQVEYFHRLLAKHWNAIAARRSADAPHVPVIERFGSAEVGEEWASGFLAGIDMRPVAWEPIFEERRAEDIVLPILALCGEAPDDVAGQMTPAARAAIAERLPVTLQLIAAYWRAPERKFPRQQPVRSVKVGRNEPCPCGSGLKFKRCCGRAPSNLH